MMNIVVYEIDDAIDAPMKPLADFNPKWFVPEDAEWFFVQSDFGNYGDITQVEPDLLVLFQKPVR